MDPLRVIDPVTLPFFKGTVLISQRIYLNNTFKYKQIDMFSMCFCCWEKPHIKHDDIVVSLNF